MDEFDLDFLKTPPKHNSSVGRSGSPFVFNKLDVNFGKKKCSKKLELAANIANVDELVEEIDRIKSKNLELQQQLKGFQETAREVQELYLKEKTEHIAARHVIDKLQNENSKTDDNLTNMSLENEQLKARLAEYDGRPINYENLIVKYVRVMTKFQENDLNKHSHDKDLVEKLRGYCTAMNYKVPPAKSPKKARARGNKVKTKESSVQCNIFVESSITCQDCSVYKTQGTQSSITTTDQASQYISTMITRQTNTEKVMQKHVQTMFPEPPAIDDILRVYSQWSNIRSVSPLRQTPPHISSPKNLIKRSTTGTCTMLCNIRRKIDYLPPNNASNIKQELFTPSASPTPNAFTTSSASGHRNNPLSNNLTNNSNSLLNLFNTTSNSLGQLSFSAFNELWQIFGKMLLSLIQNSNAGIANTNRSPHFNQQQFLDWLLELYTHSQAENTTSSTMHNQNLEQTDPHVSPSPLSFNSTSVLSTNILRPQPQKTLSEENANINNERIEITNDAPSSHLIDNNPNSRTIIKDLMNSSLEGSTQNSNPNSNEIQQTQTTSRMSELQTINNSESKMQDIQNSSKKASKSSRKFHSNYTILEQVEELLPGKKLNKKKRKALKRLLKSDNHRKKSYENRKRGSPECNSKASSVFIITNDNKSDDTVETAVDFLQTFAVTQQTDGPIEKNFSETEKIFFKKVLNENEANNDEISPAFEDSAFIKPSSTLKQPPVTIDKNTKSTQHIEHKYQELFGDSDGEELGDIKFAPKSVIKNNSYLKSSGHENENNTCYNNNNQENKVLKIIESSSCPQINGFDGNCHQKSHFNTENIPQESVKRKGNIFFSSNIEQNSSLMTLKCTDSEQQNRNEVKYSESSNDSYWNEGCHNNLRNSPQKQFLICENSSQEILAIPDLPTPILKDLECAYLSEIIQLDIAKDSEIFCCGNNQQNSISFPVNYNNPPESNENSLTSVVELSSNIYIAKEDVEIAANPSGIFKTDGKTIKEASNIEYINAIQQNNMQYETVTIQNSNAEIVTHTGKASFKSMLEPSEDECSNASISSRPVIISSTTILSSNFEKDLELSSDDESISSEIVNSDKSSIILEENEESKEISCYEESISSISSYLSSKNGAGQNESDNDTKPFENLFTCSKENLNIFQATVTENCSLNKVLPKSSTNIILSSNEKEDKEKTIANFKSKASKSLGSQNISNEFYQNKFEDICHANGSHEGNEENMGKIPNFKELTVSLYNDAHISHPSKQKEVEKIEPIEEAFKNATLQTSKTVEDESLTVVSSDIVNGILKSLPDDRFDTSLQREDNAFTDKYHDKPFPSKTKAENEQKTAICDSLAESTFNKTVNSPLWPIITVSDSSLNDEVTKCDMKNKHSDLNKTSGLGALKLLDLDKTLLHQQKLCNAIKTNTGESKLTNELRCYRHKTKTIKTEEKITTISHDKFIGLNNILDIKIERQKHEKEAINEEENLLHKNNKDDSKEKEKFGVPIFTVIESMPQTIPIQYDSVDENYKSDLEDSLSIEDKLLIDEESTEMTSKELQTNLLNKCIPETATIVNDTLDSSEISTLLNSSLYNEVLTESLKPIVDDLLHEDVLEVSINNPQIKSKRGRKRKSESSSELLPCKRSQRLRAKQIILKESFNLSKTVIENKPSSNQCKNELNNVHKEDKYSKTVALNMQTLQNSKVPEHENSLQLGFFRERSVEDDKASKNNSVLDTTAGQKARSENNEIFNISENNKNFEKQNETENQNLISDVNCEQEWQTSNNLNDCVINNFIYTDSPQSPPPFDCHNTNNNSVTETLTIIPLDRPKQFLPQNDNLKLLDVLINSYKKDNQKQILESISNRELKQKENTLKQFREQILLYCYNEMELELFCTSTSLINKLLSLCPDYNLIQKAVITVAQNAESSNVREDEFPSTIQEMPPRHLSKCLQRLFTFLRIIVTRNSNFCEDLLHKIETLLFNPKQIETLSLQATLNLTQLYLMASKVQEYLQIPKHPARLFIAKCLYFYLQKSILMIHEVLIWYPTVLPHREDKTYDRSDALIGVIQQILMNTRYDMDKSELRGKLLISKLRYEYHFEPYKPTQDEIINTLVEKLKNLKFYNISLAFGLFCKRIGVRRTQDFVLAQHLLPLANEYYNLALKTNKFDKCIEVLLEIISMIVKPLPIETDTKKYFWQFSRFLNGFERQVIQEAALCSILRLQRFNVEYCYSLLCNFQPNYTLNTHTQTMLKSFLYRRPLNFWKNLKSKNLINN